MNLNLSNPWLWAAAAAGFAFVTAPKRKRLARMAIFGVGGLLVGPRLAAALPSLPGAS